MAENGHFLGVFGQNGPIAPILGKTPALEGLVEIRTLRRVLFPARDGLGAEFAPGPAKKGKLSIFDNSRFGKRRPSSVWGLFGINSDGCISPGFGLFSREETGVEFGKKVVISADANYTF